MLYILFGRQVIAEIKGVAAAPVAEAVYWASDDTDLTPDEVDAFMAECAEEIAEAAYTYQNIRIAAGGSRDA